MASHADLREAVRVAAERRLRELQA
jgi:hypothetical protein